MKNVVITGGASGLGLALAREFYQNGYSLTLLDIDRKALNSCRNEFGQKRLLAIQCDITKEKDCNRAIQKTIRFYRKIDILINNAGVSHRSLFLNTNSDVIKKTMQINFFGTVNITCAAIEHLIESHGSIIGISSVAGIAPLLGRTGYCASKYAMRGFFDTLRAELKGQLHILMVYPSFIQTGLEQNASDGAGKKMIGSKRKNTGSEMTAHYAAARIFKAFQLKKNQFFLSKTAQLTWILMRFFPKLYMYFMEKKIGPEFDSEENRKL